MGNAISLSELRNAKVERILATKQGKVLTSPWLRRTLSVLLVVSSYVFMATLLIPTPYIRTKTNRVYEDFDAVHSTWIYDVRDTVHGICLVVIAVGFILLRSSMRRVTSLPDKYLDELQIANRDWAFKTGYLVVRRIGLGVAILFGFLVAFKTGFDLRANEFGLTHKTMTTVATYLSDLTALEPFDFYFNGFMLLAFVAYSFPLILLAWRESKFKEQVPVVIEPLVLSEPARTVKTYFDLLRLITISIGAVAAMYALGNPYVVAPLFYILVPINVYLVIPGSLFLYVWASQATSGFLRDARKQGFSSPDAKRTHGITLTFLIITHLLGITVATCMVLAFSGFGGANQAFLGLAVLAGLLMIPAQATSMTFLARLETGK